MNSDKKYIEFITLSLKIIKKREQEKRMEIKLNKLKTEIELIEQKCIDILKI